MYRLQKSKSATVRRIRELEPSLRACLPHRIWKFGPESRIVCCTRCIKGSIFYQPARHIYIYILYRLYIQLAISSLSILISDSQQILPLPTWSAWFLSCLWLLFPLMPGRAAAAQCYTPGHGRCIPSAEAWPAAGSRQSAWSLASQLKFVSCAIIGFAAASCCQTSNCKIESGWSSVLGLARQQLQGPYYRCILHPNAEGPSLSTFTHP